MKKLFINKNFQGNKDCSPVEGTLDIGTLLNNFITITKRRIKTLLFNKTQFTISNYINKCSTAYVELNPNFIDSLLNNENNKVVNIELNVDESGTLIQQLVLSLNNNGFIVNKDENYIFTVIPNGGITTQFIFKLGKGNWGSLGTLVTENNFIQIIQSDNSITTGTTDSPLADNGVLNVTQNVKTIAVVNDQFEFIDSLVEPNTSTLKLKDSLLATIFNIFKGRNLGTGAIICKGSTIVGTNIFKDFKTIKNSSSIDVVITADEITPSVNSTWLNTQMQSTVFPYKTYIAKLNQSGTSAPVAEVLYNDTGLTFTFARTNVGVYDVLSSTLTLPITNPAKIIPTLSPGYCDGLNGIQYTNDGQRLEINCREIASGLFIDNTLFNAILEIKILD